VEDNLEIFGARVHNLKNTDLIIPRNKFVVFTGLSGSGKSSLAFDTIYAEGQRRYMETFSAYARQFIGHLERPDVDKINGLNPVIAIEQKTTSRNPRSTVGTITEIYDFMRLLYARVADAYSYVTRERMVKYTGQQIIDLILSKYENKDIMILAPVVKARKGHYRELFEQIIKQGFLKVRVDGEIREITHGMQLDRYKTHDIGIVIDHLTIRNETKTRLSNSVDLAMKHGKEMLMVIETSSGEIRHFSKLLMCPTSGISYAEPEPNTFSFNSPYGACLKCNGLGTISEINIKKIIPEPTRSIRKGGIVPIGEYKNNWIFKQMEAIGEKYGFDINTPISEIPENAINVILYGSDEIFRVKNDYLGITSSYSLNFEGIVSFINSQHAEEAPAGIMKWVSSFMNKTVCPECGGTRLKKESLHFKIGNQSIADLANLDLINLNEWFDTINDHL
jgi:excinuclease ABC subunit A